MGAVAVGRLSRNGLVWSFLSPELSYDPPHSVIPSPAGMLISMLVDLMSLSGTGAVKVSATMLLNRHPVSLRLQGMEFAPKVDDARSLSVKTLGGWNRSRDVKSSEVLKSAQLPWSRNRRRDRNPTRCPTDRLGTSTRDRPVCRSIGPGAWPSAVRPNSPDDKNNRSLFFRAEALETAGQNGTFVGCGVHRIF